MSAARGDAASRPRAVVPGLGLLVGLGACSFAPPPETPATVTALPRDFSTRQAAGEYTPVRWWETFEDPVLGRLVETALAANLDLREAVGRLEELRNRYRIARAGLFPSAALGGDVTTANTPGNTGLGGQFVDDSGAPSDSTATGRPAFTLPDRFEFTTYSVSVGFAYELDFWGRARDESSAAVHDYLASRADLETVRMAVSASTISTYFEIVEAREQRELAEENVDVLRERAEITEERYRRGLIGSFELYTIRQLYRTAQADLPGVRTRLDDAEGRLAILLGRYAGRIGDLLPADLDPTVDTTPVPAGLPVRLLEDRPDVVAAAERVESARRRVGARRAERLPTVSLNGSVGFQASEPANLFRVDQWFFNLVGGLVAPLFQGGRLRANVGVAVAQYDQSLAAYVRTVLTAYAEVRTSLRAFDNERERHARILDQVEDAEASLDNQLERFRRGVGDYVSYLDARVNLVGARTAYTNAERGLAEARLAVHRSLGGAWTDAEDATASPDDSTASPEDG